MEHENEKDLKSTLNIKIPQIDSTDPEERKTARSLRITKRQENLKKYKIHQFIYYYNIIIV